MKNLFFNIIIIFLAIPIFPQDPNWLVYTPQNSGLPNIPLDEIAIDQYDVKWITAYNSLIRFDWTNWELFNSSNSIIPSEWAGTISKGGDGNVWMGGYSTPYLYDNIGLVNVSVTPWEIYDTLNSQLAYNQIAGLTPSRDSGIWINSWPGYLTYGGTVQKFTNGNWYNLTQQTLSYIDEMEEDLGGNLWYENALGSGGVFKIVNDTTIWYHFLDGIARSLETDLTGNVWMGWYRNAPSASGLLKYDGVNWEFYDQSNSNLPAYWVDNLIIDSLGNLWMSGWETIKFDGMDFTHYTPQNSDLYSTDIRDIQGEGLIKFDGMDFTLYTPQNSGLYSTDIRDIQIDEHNNKWIIHPNAISVFNENGITTVIEDNDFPTNFILYQNYPNPFNPTTKISWQSPVGSWQTLKIFDLLGNEVATLINEYKPAGEYKVEFIGYNLPSGIYFYQLKAGSFVETKKMILLK